MSTPIGDVVKADSPSGTWGYLEVEPRSGFWITSSSADIRGCSCREVSSGGDVPRELIFRGKLEKRACILAVLRACRRWLRRSVARSLAAPRSKRRPFIFSVVLAVSRSRIASLDDRLRSFCRRSCRVGTCRDARQILRHSVEPASGRSTGQTESLPLSAPRPQPYAQWAGQSVSRLHDSDRREI